MQSPITHRQRHLAQVVRASDRDAAETLGAHFSRDERAMELGDTADETPDPA